MQIYLLTLLSAVSAIANPVAEAEPVPCLWLKEKLGLCGGGGYYPNQNTHNRGTLIVYSSVTGAPTTVTVTGTPTATVTAAVTGPNSVCSDGSNNGQGAICQSGSFVSVTTVHSTFVNTLTNDIVVTAPPSVETCTEWNEVCVTVTEPGKC